MANTSLSESTAEKIKQRIITGKYVLGQQLPNEQELCESLNVSRTTIREAIKLLVSRNVLEIERGIGTFVVKEPGVSNDPFGFDFVNDQTLKHDLSHFRSVVEPDVCALAAQNATPDQIEAMLAQTHKMQEIAAKAVNNSTDEWIDEFIDQEINFHTLLYKMSGNVLFERMNDIVARSVVLNCTVLKYRQTFDFEKYSEIHINLFKAIANRDVDMARTLGVTHSDNYEKFF